MIYLFVAVGGVAGALTRFAIGASLAPGPNGFPWATLIINVSGSILLGVLMSVLPAWGASPEVRALLTVGFCGSFTTFSTFGYETLMLAQRDGTMAGAYVVASVLLGVAGVALGLTLGSTLV